jgi:pimeloyl-ACP methyl ester carboxylesterase
VHGTLDRHSSFARVRSRLAATCHVVSYDRRGYARSREVLPPASHIDDHVRDLEAVLAGRRAVLVGHSFGGTVVLTVASRRPDLVSAALVYEPGLGWREHWDSANAREPFAGINATQAAERFMTGLIGERRWQRLPLRTRDEVLRDGGTMVAELTSVRNNPPPFDPATIGVPVVVARGSLAAPRQVEGADWLVATLPHCVLQVVDGAGHNGHQSHPREFAALVDETVRLASGPVRLASGPVQPSPGPVGPPS